MSDEVSTTQLQHWVRGLQAGDAAAREQLLLHFSGRFHHLARKMLKGFPGVRRWEETDDVFQNAVLRLLRTLQQVAPPSARDLMRLASAHIRRELLDLHRHYFGPQGAGAHHSTNPDRERSEGAEPDNREPADSTGEPSRLAEWAEFHQQIEALPQEEREVFELVWYQGMPQSDVAGLLQISERTVKRRWMSARLRLREALKGELPGS
jgi:RNA polymerase sigma-70 factor (ECF subfamily)